MHVTTRAPASEEEAERNTLPVATSIPGTLGRSGLDVATWDFWASP